MDKLPTTRQEKTILVRAYFPDATDKAVRNMVDGMETSERNAIAADRIKREAEKLYTQAQVDEAVGEAIVNGMQIAKSRVLRRTEIPKDAKNPTRDFVVVLGEQIAEIIDQDIAALTNQSKAKETDSK